MREIEFRAKNINDQWRYGYLERQDLLYDENYDCSSSIQTETLGQYTGLCDKNGTKIFEGDIVNIIYKEYPIENCVVVFGDYNVFRDEWGYHYSTCGFALKFDDGSGYTTLTRKNMYEVVGNIHDNPELLEVSDDN